MGLAVVALLGCDRDVQDAPGDTDVGSSGVVSTGTEGSTTGPASATDPGSSTAASTGADSTTSGAQTSGATGEDGSSSSGGADAAPVFFAAGDVGRSTFSCDLGHSWQGNRSYDLEGDSLVCGEVAPVTCYDQASGCQLMDADTCETQSSNCDCDHHPGAVQGVAYGAGWWVGTWGWGPPGSVRRTQDGLSWETVIEGTTYGGLAYGNGTFLVGARSPRVSSDGGATWADAGPADFQAANGETIHNVRQVGFAQAQGGHFVIIATSGANRDIMLSSDEGGSWWRPEQRPDACLDGNRGILSSQDTIVLLGSGGDVCASSDGGQSWSTEQVFGGSGGPGVWDGSQFWSWVDGTAYSSVDGLSWTSKPMSASLQLGATAVDPQTGAFVSVRGGWQNWYDRQEFYRSDDGLNWEVLDSGSFEGSHRIRHIAFAETTAGACEP